MQTLTPFLFFTIVVNLIWGTKRSFETLNQVNCSCNRAVDSNLIGCPHYWLSYLGSKMLRWWEVRAR